MFILDGHAKILSVVVDGKLCDGGYDRSYGWTRFPKQLGKIIWTDELLVMPDPPLESGRFLFEGEVKSLWIYNRYFLTSEAVANYLAEKGKFE